MSRIFTSGLGEWRRSGRFSRTDLVQPAAVGCQDEVGADVSIFHDVQNWDLFMSRGCYLVPMAMDWAGPFSWELVLPGSLISHQWYQLIKSGSCKTDQPRLCWKQCLQERRVSRQGPKGFSGFVSLVPTLIRAWNSAKSSMITAGLCRGLGIMQLQLPLEGFTVGRTCAHKSANLYSCTTMQFPTNVSTVKRRGCRRQVRWQEKRLIIYRTETTRSITYRIV